MEWEAIMTIEIHSQELEALFMERLKIGGIHNVEDILKQAPESSPMTHTKPANVAKNCTGADLIAAMQSSPYQFVAAHDWITPEGFITSAVEWRGAS
jgi:hypothetical protein